MSLCAASIYDESRAAKEVLYAVPAHNYQVEVRQFHFSQTDQLLKSYVLNAVQTATGILSVLLRSTDF
jgi:hypothetical protein